MGRACNLGAGIARLAFAHPLQTLYTPFSVILIAEVYLLVYYLPTSFCEVVGQTNRNRGAD